MASNQITITAIRPIAVSVFTRQRFEGMLPVRKGGGFDGRSAPMTWRTPLWRYDTR